MIYLVLNRSKKKHHASEIKEKRFIDINVSTFVEREKIRIEDKVNMTTNVMYVYKYRDTKREKRKILVRI
jgi:hypothetical protein